MKLKTQKRIVASLYSVGRDRVWLDPSKSTEIKGAITKKDIRGLIKKEIIKIKQKQGISSSRVKKIKLQKSKGRRKGVGSRKGTFKARNPKKRLWIIKIRNLKGILKEFRDKKTLSPKNYRMLYRKAKGGLFRNVRHLNLYIEEHKLLEHGNK